MDDHELNEPIAKVALLKGKSLFSLILNLFQLANNLILELILVGNMGWKFYFVLCNLLLMTVAKVQTGTLSIYEM